MRQGVFYQVFDHADKRLAVNEKPAGKGGQLNGRLTVFFTIADAALIPPLPYGRIKTAVLTYPIDPPAAFPPFLRTASFFPSKGRLFVSSAYILLRT